MTANDIFDEYNPDEDFGYEPEPEPEPVKPAKKAPAKKAVATATVAVKPEIVGSDGKIVLTFKEGAGYDAAWVVVHASDAADALETIQDYQFKELLLKSKEIAAGYRGGETSKGGSVPARSSAPAGAKQPPEWFPASPGEGWEYRSGAKKDGSGVYHAWAPPRGSDAKWQFHNKPK